MDLLEGVRIAHVLPLVRGRLLDIGCGFNNLMRIYHGRGYGVDVHPWPGVNIVIQDASILPFRDGSFTTVTLIASLNHIPDRSGALVEVRRVLHSEGKLVMTMIGPVIGWVAHLLFRRDQRERGHGASGERKGLSRSHLEKILIDAGFRITHRIRFELGLNCVYVAEKC